jgi:hypothetical protein
VPGTGREPDLNERQLDARRRVHTIRWRPWAVSRAQPDRACGTSLVCSGACASGRCGRGGADGLYARSKRRASWWRRWGYWRRTSVTRGQPEADLPTPGRAPAQPGPRHKKTWQALARAERPPTSHWGCAIHFEVKRQVRASTPAEISP